MCGRCSGRRCRRIRRLLACSKQRRLRLSAPRKTSGVRVVTRAIEVRSRVARLRIPRHHRDAINWTWRNAQLAPGTNVSDYRMCLAPGTDDRIDGAGREAFDAPDTTLFVNEGNQRRALDAIGGIERKYFAMKQVSECGDRRTSARRTLIDLRETAGDRRRIRATSIVSAASALCLRKKGVDVVGECHGITSDKTPSPAAPRPSPVAPRRRKQND